jgi:endonuclease III
MDATWIVTTAGGRYSRELGIDLDGGRPHVFRWFLAAVLFGARISETIVKRTVRAFEEAGITTPEAVERTGWDGLVEILDRGGYVRYDFKTATKLLDLCRNLRERYAGELGLLHAEATGPRDLEDRIKALAKGIGDVTVNIFLREMRGIWSKARPLPSDSVLLAAANIGLVPRSVKGCEAALEHLLALWKSGGERARSFPDLEAALLRIGKNFCRKEACPACPVRTACGKACRRKRVGTDHHRADR